MPWGRKLNDIFFGPAPEQVTRKAVEAINAQDWTALEAILSPDFKYFDWEDKCLEGGSLFIAAMQAMSVDAPDFRIDVDEVETTGSVVLMRGRIHAASPRFQADSVWRVNVGSGKVQRWQNYRAYDTVRLYEYASKLH